MAAVGHATVGDIGLKSDAAKAFKPGLHAIIGAGSSAAMQADPLAGATGALVASGLSGINAGPVELSNYAAPIAAGITMARGGGAIDMIASANVAMAVKTYNDDLHREHDKLEIKALKEKAEEARKVREEREFFDKAVLESISKEEVDKFGLTRVEREAISTGKILPSLRYKIDHAWDIDKKAIAVMAAPLALPALEAAVTSEAVAGVASGIGVLAARVADKLAASGKNIASILKRQSRSSNIDQLSSAKSAANKPRLNKQLASEAQMKESGIVIAGGGARKKLDDAPRLVAEYGGKVEEWVKKASTKYGNQQTRWYENIKTGQKVEFKTKIKD